MKRDMEEKLQEVAKLYFGGCNIKEAIEVVRNESIQASGVSTRANRKVQ
jgi:hypothetical protein